MKPLYYKNSNYTESTSKGKELIGHKSPFHVAERIFTEEMKPVPLVNTSLGDVRARKEPSSLQAASSWLQFFQGLFGAPVVISTRSVTPESQTFAGD